jgi:homocysteine S-methyltransferase
MSARELRELIEDGRVHVMDGAMGTMLYARGVFVNVCYDELNVTEPRLVQDVHEAYVSAGSEIIETNTFGANPVKLSSWGLDERTEEINRAAAQLARAAARGKATVLGAVGPLGIRIEPWGPTSRAEAQALFRRQLQGLLEGGAHGFVLETFSDLSELEQAYRAARDLCDLPVFAQITVGEDGATAYGTAPEVAAWTMADWGTDVVGLNCSVGPAVILDAVERMAEVTDRPLSALPNAGLPRAVGDRMIYMASPEYMAQYARRLLEAGVRFVGGCCGTTPDHISRIRDTVASVQPRPVTVGIGAARVPPAPPGLEESPLASRSAWGRKLSTGSFVTSVEVMPGRGWDAGRLVEAARALHRAGVDAVAIPDSPLAQGRMAAVPAALVVERDVGIETLVHYTCRNRNMIGMVSDLLGAAAAGLRNVLLVTGDLPTEGPYAQATPVFDIDSIGLTNVVHHLNRGVDPGGSSIGEATRFVIGVALNQGARDMERELERFAYKVEAGAHFAVTQPVFAVEDLAPFLERSKAWAIPVVAGVWPFTSLRNAEFLANEVPGVRVPDSVVQRMRDADARGQEAAQREGMAIANEVIEAVRPLVAGVHVGTPGPVTEAIELLASTDVIPLSGTGR